MEGFKDDAHDFKSDSTLDGESVQLFQGWSNVFPSVNSQIQSSSIVLDSLQALKQIFG